MDATTCWGQQLLHGRQVPGMGRDTLNCHLNPEGQLVSCGRKLPTPLLEHQDKRGSGGGGEGS
jgi:hypothetical protein